MDDRNDILARLREQMNAQSIIRGIEDLRVGDIIYYDMDRSDGIIPNQGYNSRLKYVVVAGSKENKAEVGVVLINTGKDYSIAADWQAEQYLIRQSDYPGILDHDSWIDCTDFKELRVSKIKTRKATKKGHLINRDLANIMRHLKENDFIEPRIRKIYGIDKYTIVEDNL